MRNWERRLFGFFAESYVLPGPVLKKWPDYPRCPAIFLLYIYMFMKARWRELVKNEKNAGRLLKSFRISIMIPIYSSDKNDMIKQSCNVLYMIRQIIKVSIIVLLSGGQLLGLNPNVPVNRYIVEHWEENVKGLPSNSVISIAQTPDGYLWIATSKGLVRFDGMKFSFIQLVKEGMNDRQKSTVPDVDVLFVDKKGTLWIGSAAGLTSYQFQTGQFNTLTTPATADGLAKDRIRFIKADTKGNLWISFFNGYLSRYADGKFTVYNESHGLGGNKINAIIEDKKGNLLFGTRENGVFQFRDETFSQVPIMGLDNAYIITMYFDRKGELWIGTNKGLLRVAAAATGEKNRIYTTSDGLADDYITDITEDNDLNLWVGTVKGLNRIKKNAAGTLEFNRIMVPFTIMCLLEDNEKNLWVGTFDSGIQRLRNSRFKSYDALESFGEEILLSQFEDRNGDTWVGTLGDKLFRCKKNEFIESLELPGISGAGITCIADDAAGNLWLGTNGNGVFQRKNKTMVQFTTRDGLSDNMVKSISRDSLGNLWFCTFDGVTRCSGGVMEALNSRNGLLGKMAHNVYEDKKQDIWIAADKGITVLKKGRIAKENISYFLKDVSVTCIYQEPAASGADDSIYWIATHGAGLKRLKNGVITSFTTAEGLTTNFLYQFFEDAQENFWFMSDSGILRVSKNELNRFPVKGANNRETDAGMINCTSFGITDGMKSAEFNNEFSRSSALKAGNGEFRFITKKGITIVNPEQIHIDNIPPPVVIEAVLFNEQPVPFHQFHQLPKTNESAAYKGITDLQFRFTAPTFLSPEKVKFKYRLEAVDKEWVLLAPGKERAAHYKDLSPGVYTFNVIAGNSEGVWNQVGDTVSFTLKPFFYETIIFRIAVILILVASAAFGFYSYKKQLALKKIKYKSSTLNPQFADECVKKLKNLMEIEKLYRESDLSLQGLANKMAAPHHILSQVLNEKLNRNFSDYINSYRIEEAKKILSSHQKEEQKITRVAFDVGFNTMVAFYNAFKKYTGMTPSEYRKKTGDESSHKGTKAQSYTKEGVIIKNLVLLGVLVSWWQEFSLILKSV